MVANHFRSNAFVPYAGKQTSPHRPDDHAAHRSWRDDAGPAAACDAQPRRVGCFEKAVTEGEIDENRRGTPREGENHAA